MKDIKNSQLYFIEEFIMNTFDEYKADVVNRSKLIIYSSI